jgi:hypothetical protein
MQRLCLFEEMPGGLLGGNGTASFLSKIYLGDRYLNLQSHVYEPSNPTLYRGLSFLKKVLLLPRSAHLTHATWKGISSGGENDLVVSYIGEGESYDFLKRLCFSKVIEEMTESCEIWTLKNNLGDISSGNILFVELNRLLQKFLPAGGYVTFPWIRQKVYLKDEFYKNRRRKIRDKYGRKARKFRYRFEIVRDASAIKKFYEDLLVPYINFRFGDTAHLRNLKEIQRIVKHGFLLQVYDQGKWIAGAACRRRRQEVTLFALGLISDFAYHLQRGALSSVYYFLFQWAEQNDIDTIDLLRSKADVNDGVFEHKRSWGAKVEKDIWPHTIIMIYTPRDIAIPSVLKGFLVWSGNEFIELSKAIERC